MALKVGKFSFERLKIENLYNAYLGMTSREQTMALIAAAAVIILVVVLPIMVASNRISRLERDVVQSRRQLRDVMRAIESYDGRRVYLDQLQKMVSGGFDSSISSTLESIAEKHGMKDRIDSLKERAVAPSELFDEASVDVRLKRVRLEQLVAFLHAIEDQPDKLLRLKKLSIKTRFDKKQDLDVSFTVSTYRLLEGVGEGT